MERLLARAARLSSESVPSGGERRAPRALMSAEQAETAAMEQAIQTLHQGDAPAALQQLERFADFSMRPDTLTLHAHLLLLSGQVERARSVLERALRANPSHPDVLDEFAAFHRHQGDSVSEFGMRLRRLRSSARLGARPVIDAVASLMQALARDAGLARHLPELCTIFDRMEAQATREERLELAEWLFALKSTRERARHLVEANAPPRPGTELRTLRWFSTADVPPAHVIRRHEQPDPDLPGTQLRVTELTGAAVLPGLQWSPWIPDAGGVLHGFVTRRTVTARESPASPLLLQNSGELVLRTPLAAPRLVQDQAVLIGSDPNYYHFVVDHLSRLAVLEAQQIRTEGALWITGQDMLPWQLDYLRLFGIDEARLLPLAPDEHVVFRHLIAPCPLGRGARQISPLVARWARERIAPALGADAHRPGRRIYLSRAGTARRRVANEEELLAWLQAQGFECVHPETLTIAQQVQMCSEAIEMVSPAGAALTNMIYMPPGGRVTVLYNSYLPPSVESLYLDYLARASGHRFTAVPGAPHGMGTDDQPHADFLVPLVALQKSLQPGP